MKRFYVIGFLLLMGFDTLAQLGLKYTAIHALPLVASTDWLLRILSQPWIYLALIGYLGAFFMWLTLLKKAPIGPAFAASHLDVISVMFCSHWLFSEHLSLVQLVGAGLILCGIICLAVSESKNAEHQIEAIEIH
ncbi:DMT family transporter [Aquirhabdus sp.]|uniref:DMT family transporter n=1 Tax=Aquirhabdus sp. TaxID=2824160 RepID=UPI00396C4754